MQPHCFGRENKEKDCHCIVGHFTIRKHDSKTRNGGQLPVQNAKLQQQPARPLCKYGDNKHILLLPRPTQML